MKKIISVLLLITMVLSVVACGDESPANDDSAKPYKAALLINGNLGDKSFNDSAYAGLEKLKAELGEDKFDFSAVEMGGLPSDESKYESTVEDFCELSDFDVIIVATWQMESYVTKFSEKYPDQKFILYDEGFDFDENPRDNVYNILYKQNEVSFLIGSLAAMMTTDESIKNINSDKSIAFLGGMEDAVIQDFLIGYIEGAKYIDPEVSVTTAYVNNFTDVVAAKSLALLQYESGVDIGYNVASMAGLGQIKAAHDMDLYAFGVDSDQAALMPEMAANIPTSAMKNVGNSLYDAIKLDMNGELAYGTTVRLGLKENGVGLAEGSNYETIVPENIRAKIAEITESIKSGDIVVDTAIGKSEEEINDLLDSIN